MKPFRKFLSEARARSVKISKKELDQIKQTLEKKGTVSEFDTSFPSEVMAKVNNTYAVVIKTTDGFHTGENETPRPLKDVLDELSSMRVK